MARVAAEDLQMLALLMLIPPVLQKDTLQPIDRIVKVPALFCRELPCAMKLLTSSQMSLFLPDFHQRCTSSLNVTSMTCATHWESRDDAYQDDSQNSSQGSAS